MNYKSIKAVLILLVFQVYLCSTQATNKEKKLLSYLLEKQEQTDTYTRPVEDSDNGLDVGFVLWLIDVDRPDPQRDVFAFKFWQFMNWYDFTMQWNPSDHDGLKRIRLPAYRLWQPDIKLTNGLGHSRGDYVNFLITSDGLVTWIPPITYSTRCSKIVDGGYLCDLSFLSWTYPTREMNITNTEPDINLSEFIANPDYSVVHTTAWTESKKYPCCEDLWSVVTFTIQLQEVRHGYDLYSQQNQEDARDRIMSGP